VLSLVVLKENIKQKDETHRAAALRERSGNMRTAAGIL
jgi:hypothetical protein